MNVSYFGYEPGLTDGNEKSSTGNAHWLRKLQAALADRGVNFFNGSVGEKSVRGPQMIEAMESGDIFLFSLRWPMDPLKYKQRSLANSFQSMLLKHAFDKKIPCIVHDSDLMHPDVFKLLDEKNPDAILTMPALYPPKGYQSLMFPNPYENLPIVPFSHRSYHIAYVGNNYMRYEQMKNTYKKLSGKYYITVWGNWMSKAIENDAVETLFNDFPGVTFESKVNQSDIQGILSHSFVTHQFAKPEYCKYGFITPRLFEATTSGCVTIFPDEFRIPEKYESVFKGLDVDELVSNELYYKSVVESQREIADELDGTYKFVDFLLSHV